MVYHITTNYMSSDYCAPERMASYGYQVREVCGTSPKNVLEIGVGCGLVSFLLNQFDLNITTFDIDRSLNPDIVGSILDTNLKSNSFDTVLCCEVLEHLPFDCFPKSLLEIHRICRKYVIISLPDSTRYWMIQVKLPKIRIKWSIDIPIKPKVHIFDGEHYWEIGKRGYSLKSILDAIKSSGFSVIDTYRIFENPYHRIFVLKK